MKKIELLAPAGDLERLKINLLYGADAVYIGGYQYGLRANATNFSLEEIKNGCEFAHKLQKKVYLTLNIVFHNEDMVEVESYIKEVVELSLLDIETIIKRTKLDIEVFIHGAMCTCFSGRCALSNYITNRDANRGGCSQVCRFSFLTKDKNFTMATKDLNAARYIERMIQIGVRSLKVEGRMRSIYYLATVIGTYRKIIDAIYEGKLNEEFLKKQEIILSRVANRETSSHYLDKEADYTDQYYTGRSEVSNQDYLGQVISYDKKNKLVKIYERNYFEVGSQVELFTPSGNIILFTVEKLFDENQEEIQVARHPDNIYYIYLDTDILVEEYSMIRFIKKNRI